MSASAGRADQATASDGYAASMLASAGLAGAVVLGDQLGAALGAVAAVADAVHPLDAYSAGDIGISEARVWRVTARPRVSPVLARSRVWRVPPPRRGGYYAMSGFVGRWPDKDPADVLDYTIDWSEELAAPSPADAIASVVWTVPGGLTQGATLVQGGRTTVWLSGGTAGTDYTVTCRITTDQGRVIERSRKIRVREM